ncbi:uncharacterized protein CC84DRAFT_1163523 [Paraphaeosphaeria sporulosa]|uniref:Uncharacterized protein n=1 Tax=Paraphaeosphaeria sporulosa TaxID=1460663 RepID=A0A177CIH9_9PLEO|nr:uncharacterized protein CC84DRAFT_1163523 [Paraphaeosphaeria sporulosa]OAG07313.1 hypothetical protein CC84DRAFT_1163523 [Paraphaeosphaeria sporulosa]
MRFSLFVVAGLSAVATALPQRAAGQGRFRGGRPSDQSAQDGSVQSADLSEFHFPSTGATPGNAQAGVGNGAATEGNLNDQGQEPPNNQGQEPPNNQGQEPPNNQGQEPPNNQDGLPNQGAGNVKYNGTLPGNDGQNQNGQNQNGGVQNGPNQNAGSQNRQNQTGGSQNGANQTTGGFDVSLVPEFGVEAGQTPDGTGNCLGLNNVKIPCSCPPDRQEFIQKVQAAAAAGNSEGVPIKFPLGGSSASKKARIGASIIVLQNLNGRGVGCPAASTTFLAQQAAA